MVLSQRHCRILRFALGLRRPRTARLRRIVQPKLDFNRRWDNHGFAVLRAGAEAPLLHCLNSFLVETRIETALNFNIVRSAVAMDLDVQDDCSLDAGPLLFRCVPWCASGNYRRSLG